ncbi:MAG: VCBS repeat-containing protein [Deltaproteobacteria bacterium]|nr:VCBS repeat-containing protein [Deltaproteobacteria bacterium]
MLKTPLALGFAAAAILLCSPSAFAARKLSRCDFDKDGRRDQVEIVKGRRARIRLSKSQRLKVVRFRGKFKFFRCADLNGDGRDEILSYKRKVKVSTSNFTVFYVFGKALSGPKKVCAEVRDISYCEVWRAGPSRDFSSSDPRNRSTSFVTRKGCPGSFSGCLSVYNARGEVVQRMGSYARARGSYDSTHYGCWDCGSCESPQDLVEKARRRTGSPSLYIRDDNGGCVRIPDAGRCYNSSHC